MTTESATAMRLPERMAIIDARLLPTIIELYLATKLSTGAVTEKTQYSYFTQLAPWREFWRQAEHIHNHTLSPAIFNHALEWMRNEYRNERNQQPAPNTIHHCWVRVRQVLKWAYENNCTGTTNMTDWCPSVDYVDPDVHYPTVEELAAILAQPEGEFRLRDTAVIAFLVSTGARRYEAAHADAALLNWTGTPSTNLDSSADHGGWILLKMVKGDRDGIGTGRPVAFDSVCGLLLKCYLRSVNRTTGPLFGMSDVAIGQMVDRHAESAGAGLVSPHAFRRMLADHWDEIHGLSGRHALKKQLGHAPNSADVTERHYLTKNTRRIARDVQRWHVSPLQAIPLEWSKYPVHIPK